MLSKRELEELRPWVSQSITQILGFFEAIIVNAAVDCISRSLSRQATTDELFPYLDQKTDAFVENLYRKILEIKSSKLSFATSDVSSKKRNIRDIFSSDADGSQTDDVEPPKKKRASRFIEMVDSPADAGSSDSGDIQKLLATTMKQIEERKKQTQALLAQQSVGSVNVPQQQGLVQQNFGVVPQVPLLQTPLMQRNTSVHPLAYSREKHLALGMAMGGSALDKAVKAAELQARIKSQLALKPDLLKPSSTSGPTPLILDEEGRTIDSSGKTVQLTPRAPQFMVNIRAKQRASFKQVSEKKTTVREEKLPVGSVYFDSRMSLAAAQRNRKQLKFNEPGKYIKQAQMVRAKTQLEHLQSQIASVARKTGISSATKLALIAPSADQAEDVPDVEWWDLSILPTRSYSDVVGSTLPPNKKYREISNLIEHPCMVQPPGEPSKPTEIPVMLTSKERKKLRRQRRREAEKEKQEKIQFGLIEKPEPKVRISNLMRVLGSEAVQDPTKVEAHVRSQMAERQRKHEKANAERKLTPEERKAKKLRKQKEDLSCGVHVTVYRVRDMSNPADKFKVDINAQQYHLTGCTLLYQDVNIVIVEGGPRSLKKFKRLMIHRIKWKPKGKRGADDDDEEDSDDETSALHKQKACSVVWEGKVLDRAFNDWKVRYFPTENLARDHLKRHGVEHYWDLALSQAIVEQEGD